MKRNEAMTAHQRERLFARHEATSPAVARLRRTRMAFYVGYNGALKGLPCPFAKRRYRRAWVAGVEAFRRDYGDAPLTSACDSCGGTLFHRIAEPRGVTHLLPGEEEAHYAMSSIRNEFVMSMLAAERAAGGEKGAS